MGELMSQLLMSLEFSSITLESVPSRYIRLDILPFYLSWRGNKEFQDDFG